MTTIDQAFVKAYVQQPAVAALEPSRAVPLSQALAASAAGTGAARTGPPRPHIALAPTPPDEPAAPDEQAMPDEQAAPPRATAFRPLLQVDCFAWPAGCARMERAAAEPLAGVVAAVEATIAEGRRAVGIGALRRGDGCTTLMLCLAKRLAQLGRTVAVVDADLDHPRLARRLGVGPEVGWEAVLEDRLPLHEICIESVRDRVALTPLCEPLDAGLKEKDPAAAMAVLREHYDVVLVDLGRVGHSGQIALGPPTLSQGWLDAALVVHNPRSSNEEDLRRTWQTLAAAGVRGLGTIENFV